MTPAEFLELVEAFKERERREWYRAAWFTSYLLQPFLKRGRTIDPEKLLPESMRFKKEAITKEEAMKELEELKRSLKIE